jgi:hypothetical protein
MVAMWGQFDAYILNIIKNIPFPLKNEKGIKETNP